MYKFNYIILLTLMFLLVSVSCNQKQDNAFEVDFAESETPIDSTQAKNESSVILVAVSTMISPKETYFYYQELFEYLSNALGKEVKFIQRETYKEVNDLLIKNEVDIAFICTGAYLENQDQIDLLVAPVCYGKPYYQAYVIVNKESNIERFEQLKNKTFVYTDPLSNTGKQYAERRVTLLGYTDQNYFKKIIYSGAHDISIQLINSNMSDGATIDGLIYDYMYINNRDRLKNIKIIEKSKFYGIPPIVCSKAINQKLKLDFQNILTSMNKDSIGKSILNNLLIDKFVIVTDTLYKN